MPIDTFFKFPSAVAMLMTVAHVLALLFLTLVVANLLIGDPRPDPVAPMAVYRSVFFCGCFRTASETVLNSISDCSETVLKQAKSDR
jgi:hypothetical protein